ncbi:MAG: Undecaprenyl phosphate-alpha-4-amino-4-deoxy-L-arabinose arabinosyl transferase [Chroococcidiopsis sp. SAG 2025]|uniref:ArnT family glycosyltransferase n=1 Tax=Chroococcidiopsis sp. SAG 2025 TaxID=171389 RepID=UPI002936EE10|nr:glycosyltransferase family 39 protein [Chroococcidiopsis sp. SAG 2025]MDV2993407.1 Undecaprenyl phosphate-alpha-4-amino-4-deoxy-L-arabinose arabinosyl transferase [Chroococcidiopsis sp. SAG 2025]
MRLKQVQRADILVFISFAFLVFLLRLPAFFEFGINNNGDEGLYFLIARDWIAGKLPYTEIWDNKPIGIYLIYSLGIFLFGNSVFSTAIMACIAVTITCFILYKFGMSIGNGQRQLGLIAGLLYATFSTGNDELAANTEIFFAVFTTFSFYQLFQVNTENSVRRNSLRLFIIGLAMGIALSIKQVIIFEFIAIFIFTAIALRFLPPKTKRYRIKYLCQIYVFLLFGFLLPTILIVFYFWINGHFNDYISANFTANLLRVTGERVTLARLASGLTIQIKRNLFLLLGLLATPIYMIMIGKKNLGENRKLTYLYLLVWIFAALLGISSPKSFYPNYFIQVLPSLALLNAYLINSAILNFNKVTNIKSIILLSFILITPIFNNLYYQIQLSGKYIYFRSIKGIEDWGNTPSAIARYLNRRVSSTDYIYVFNYHAVIYCLVPAKVPTRYAFPLFITTKLANITGKEPAKELDAIMAKKPLYVIKSSVGAENKNILDKMNNYLRKNYSMEKSFVDLEREIPGREKLEIQLYRRI